MNRILSTPPAPTPQTFVFGTGSWLVFGFRCFLFFAGAMATVISTQHWAVTPLVARFLAVIVASSLLVWSVWPKPWRYTTRFIANENGVYFAAYPTLTLSRAQPEVMESWIGVPWKHITNIRVATESGEDGKCVAFDVQASPIEKASFFGSVGIPRDRGEPSTTTVFAAYGGWPPSAMHAAQKLHNLKRQTAV